MDNISLFMSQQFRTNSSNMFLHILTSDVARPLSYKTKTIYFFKTKIG